MGLKFVLLSLALVASGVRCTGDHVQQSISMLNNGTEGSTRVIAHIKRSVALAEDAVRQAEKRMEQITEKIGTLGVKKTGITKTAFEKYDNAKKEIRGAHRKLRSLAYKTVNACEDLELYLEGWDVTDKNTRRIYLKEQLTIMEDLMKDSIKIVKEAEKKYEEAIDNIEGVNTKLRDFSREMTNMLDTTSAEHSSWTTNLRAGVYSAAGSVTVGMIVADIFGCLGICSAVGTSISWGTAIPAVEASIASVEAKLEELKSIGDQAKRDVGQIKTTTGDLIKVLENELSLITAWKNDAENLNRKLDRMDLDKFKDMPIYRTSFARALRNLRESAQEFLNQPENLFPNTLKRRRLVENAQMQS